MKCGNTMRGIINCFELIHGASAWSASSWLAEIELRLSSPGRTVLASARPILARSAASGAFLRTSEKCCNSWSIRKATGSENIYQKYIRSNGEFRNLKYMSGRLYSGDRDRSETYTKRRGSESIKLACHHALRSVTGRVGAKAQPAGRSSTRKFRCGNLGILLKSSRCYHDSRCLLPFTLGFNLCLGHL